MYYKTVINDVAVVVVVVDDDDDDDDDADDVFVSVTNACLPLLGLRSNTVLEDGSRCCMCLHVNGIRAFAWALRRVLVLSACLQWLRLLRSASS